MKTDRYKDLPALASRRRNYRRRLRTAALTVVTSSMFIVKLVNNVR
jgi:hypothetical protein